MSASVKIMLSYDYCHFEIALGSDEAMTLEQVDAMRKDAQRLADKAVKQYKIAKAYETARIKRKGEYEELKREAERIVLKPESERTLGEVAKLKKLADTKWAEHIEALYDYEDDIDYPEECDCY